MPPRTREPEPGPARERRHRRVPSPLGELVAVAEDDHLVALHLPTGRAVDPATLGDEDPGLVPDVVGQLDEYFSGRRHEFDLPLAPVGTDFQQRVWSVLRTIPYGTTWSYGEVADHVGGPHTTRAVGLANGANPIAIVVPCHRVVGAGGDLVGYAGGLPAKRFLLDLEVGTQRLFEVS